MTNDSKRLEAAVKAWDHHWGDRYGDEALEEMGEEVSVALAAADAVMFNDETVEDIGQVIHDNICGCGEERVDCADYERDSLTAARAVIAALKGAGDE